MKVGYPHETRKSLVYFPVYVLVMFDGPPSDGPWRV